MAGTTIQGRQIIDNGVTYAKISEATGLSVLGRSANSTGNLADIVAGTDGYVLRRSGTTIGFGTIVTEGITDSNVTYNKIQDAAGLSVLGRSTNTTGVMKDITAGTDGHVLRLSGTTLGFGTVATGGITNAAVTYAKIQNFTAMSVLGRSANSTGVSALISAGTDGHVLRRSGTTLGFGTIATAGIANNAITTALITDNNVTLAKLQTIATNSLLGRYTASTGNVEVITLGSAFSFSSNTLNVAVPTMFVDTTNRTISSVSYTEINGPVLILSQVYIIDFDVVCWAGSACEGNIYFGVSGVSGVCRGFGRGVSANSLTGVIDTDLVYLTQGFTVTNPLPIVKSVSGGRINLTGQLRVQLTSAGYLNFKIAFNATSGSYDVQEFKMKVFKV